MSLAETTNGFCRTVNGFGPCRSFGAFLPLLRWRLMPYRDRPASWRARSCLRHLLFLKCRFQVFCFPVFLVTLFATGVNFIFAPLVLGSDSMMFGNSQLAARSWLALVCGLLGFGLILSPALAQAPSEDAAKQRPRKTPNRSQNAGRRRRSQPYSPRSRQSQISRQHLRSYASLQRPCCIGPWLVVRFADLPTLEGASCS